MFRNWGNTITGWVFGAVFLRAVTGDKKADAGTSL